MTETAIVSELIIYPIKSLPGIKIDQAVLTKYGLSHFDDPRIIDRKWMIVDENGSFLTQRQIPKMSLIELEIDGDFLVLSGLNKSEKLKVSISPSKTKKNCRVWQSRVDGYIYGLETGISKWLSDFLDREKLNMICFDIDFEARKVKDFKEKACNASDDDMVIYSDYSPFMLISENSLVDLNNRLDNKVTFKNFRPNIIAKNCDAFAEDSWSNLYIGESEFRMIKHCTRCLMTTVIPDKGIKSPDQQPLKTLQGYRLEEERYGLEPKFGINLTSKDEGNTIHVGDEIILTK